MLVFFTNWIFYGISGQIFGLISSFLSNRWLWIVLDDGKSSQEYPVNTRAPQGSILGPTLFLLNINGLPDGVICNIVIHADGTTLYSKCDQASDLWQQLASEVESDIQDTVDWCMLISMLEKSNWFRLTGLVTLLVLMWKGMGLFSLQNLPLHLVITKAFAEGICIFSNVCRQIIAEPHCVNNIHPPHMEKSPLVDSPTPKVNSPTK